MEGENPFEEILHSRWLWISAACLAAAIVGLAVAYYLRHPDRSLFEDFARRSPLRVEETNGRVPGEAATVGADFLGGEAEG